MANTYFSSTGIDDLLDYWYNGAATGYAAISLHSATPSTSGAAEITGGSYARVNTAWSPPASSAMSGSQVTLNVPAGATISYFGVWTSTSSGSYLGGGILPATESYGEAGTYLLTPTITGVG